MSHDPLCKAAPYRDAAQISKDAGVAWCQCDLIAKVESRTEDRMFAEWSAADAYRDSGLTT